MVIKGKVHLFEDNIDTDSIIPGRYCNSIEEYELAKNCMHDIRKDFYKSVEDGDIIVAGENFGCGSSREVAPIAIRGCGIKCVIASSFARIFYRNAINIGLRVIELDLHTFVDQGDVLEIDINKHMIRDLEIGDTYNYIPKENALIEDIIIENGLISYIKNRNFNMCC